MKENRLPYHLNDSGFKVPKGYFEQLEDHVMDSVAAQMKGQQPQKAFKVPDHYFEGLEDKLMERLENEGRETKVRKLHLKDAFYYAAGVAAVFVAIVTTFFFDRPNQEGMETVDMLTLEGYLHEAWNSPATDIHEMIHQEEYGYAPAEESSFDQEALLQYLNENIEEPALIFNED